MYSSLHSWLTAPSNGILIWYESVGGVWAECPDNTLKNVHTYYFDNILAMLFALYHELLGASNLVCSTCGFLPVFLLRWVCLAVNYLSHSCKGQTILKALVVSPAPRPIPLSHSMYERVWTQPSLQQVPGWLCIINNSNLYDLCRRPPPDIERTHVSKVCSSLKWIYSRLKGCSPNKHLI